MHRRFAFEGTVHETLETVPRAVRRKLDPAGIRVSRPGWRAPARGERLSLWHLPAKTAEDVAVYREVLLRSTARAGIPVDPAPGAPSHCRAWGPLEVPSRPHAQLGAEEARALDGRRLARLSDEERYPLYKLAGPARDRARLRIARLELGFGEGAAPTARCSRKAPPSR